VGVDDGADVGAALVDGEVEAELAEHAAAADHLALRVDLDEVAVLDEPLRGGRRGRDEARPVARGDVAVVVRDPAGRVQVARDLGDLRPQRLAGLHGPIST
jgi:hypothetical protein